MNKCGLVMSNVDRISLHDRKKKKAERAKCLPPAGVRKERVLIAYEVSVSFTVQVSRDSGIVSPSDHSSASTDHLTDTNNQKEYNQHAFNKTEQHQGPPPPNHRQEPFQGGPDLTRVSNPPPPVKAELVTNELDDDGGAVKPPPYHIAAARSKHAGEFSQMARPPQPHPPPTRLATEEHFYENQVTHLDISKV